MSHLTHVQKIKLEKCDGIVLLRGETPAGDPIYAYVQVDAMHIEMLYEAYENGDVVDYSQFKGIIKQDWGEEPPGNVKRYMETHYNFVHPE